MLVTLISLFYNALSLALSPDLTADDINLNLVKKYLKETGSTLPEGNDLDPIDIYRNLELVTYDRDVSRGGKRTSVYGPRNVALLLFHPNPHLFFRGAQTEIGIYSHDRPLEEKKIIGPIDQQIEEVLSYISTSTEEEARHEYIAYPKKALREAIVNAFHHRSYEASDSDPIKIHLNPDSIEIISYPGPDPTLTKNDFNGKKSVPPVPSRNRRITNFLKDKKLAEGRFSGVKTIYRSMKRNANSEPVFDFTSSYFRVTLPGHPKYIAYSVIRDVETSWAKGDKQDAINLLIEFLDEHFTEKPSFLGPELSERLVCKLITLHENDVNHPAVEPYLKYISEKLQRCIPLAEELKKWCDEYQTGDVSTGITIVKGLVNEGARYEQLTPAVKKAVDLLNRRDSSGKRMEVAIQNAHKLFEEMGEVTRTYSHVAYHFASCKYNLYEMQANSKQSRINLLDFLVETEEYANIALQLTNQEHKKFLAKEYLLLGYIHVQKLIVKKSTEEKVKDYYTKARKFDPSIKINRTLIPPGLRDQFGP